MGDKSNAYYEKGSVEVATETPLTVAKLEHRRKLTRNSERLCIVLVGLPGRGKSFVARKLQGLLTWRGSCCKVFNVGKYRRQAHADLTRKKGNSIGSEHDLDSKTVEKREGVGACDASFFDPNNAAAKAIREEVAKIALEDMLEWLDSSDEEYDAVTMKEYNGKEVDSLERQTSNLSTGSSFSHRKERIAIFDATNSTVERREWILRECTSSDERAGKTTGVVFVESICDDQELLEENFRFKVANSPDYLGMSTEEALDDIRKRVQKYEEQYETIHDDTQSYIKIYNLSSKILVNHIYGRMAKSIVPALMAWNIGTRPIFVCRAGQTTDVDMADATDETKQSRGDKLGIAGCRFRDALCNFIEREGLDHMNRRATAFAPSLTTGTSISGLMPLSSFSCDEDVEDVVGSDGTTQLPFPCHVMSSTMPRAVQTATWEPLPFPVVELSNLNPLDKGDFSGMELEEIKGKDPDWYSQLENDPFRTRFPGGECYSDLMNRLESCIIDMEQQISPVVVISHVSVIQVLVAYFRCSPVEKCSSIEVPMHTVMKFTPVRGGGWLESHHKLTNSPNASDTELCTKDGANTAPIWGDHPLSRKTSKRSLESSTHSSVA